MKEFITKPYGLNWAYNKTIEVLEFCNYNLDKSIILVDKFIKPETDEGMKALIMIKNMIKNRELREKIYKLITEKTIEK